MKMLLNFWLGTMFPDLSREKQNNIDEVSYSVAILPLLQLQRKKEEKNFIN